MAEEKEIKMNRKQKMKEYLKGWSPYRYKRYYTFAIITLFALIIPWITIDDVHFFLLNFDHKQMHLFFTKFDMQELYMLPFLLIFGFLGVFFLTTLAGRIWCGWLCPQTIFRIIYRDLISTKILGIRRTIQNKQEIVKGQYGKRVIAFSIWSILSVIAAANFIWFFVPPEDFFEYIKNPNEHNIMMGTLAVIAGFLIYDIIKLKEDFCIYVCPYARIQSVMYDEETIQTIYNTHRGGRIYEKDQHTKLANTHNELLAIDENNECTYCNSCVRVCPTHIDIKAGTQLECINCLECADACTEVMGALGKPSLITWTSYSAIEEERKAKFFRFRTIAYGVALTASLIGLFWMSSTKEFMLLNINRDTQLYKIKDDGQRVTNAYKFLFQNTENKDHRYYFEIVGNDDIVIQRPKKSFSLQAGKKATKIVVLKTNKALIKDYTKDTSFPITIRAYAIDDKERVTVERASIFVYPRYDLIEKSRK